MKIFGVNAFANSKRPVVTGVSLAMLSLLLASCGAANANSSSNSSGKLSELQQGLNFYKGKTITFVAPDSPGGGFDQYARVYEPFIASYLHASVVVLNVPAGNTVAGQNQVAQAHPDGLTVGWLNAGPDVEDSVLGIPGLQFNPSTQALLGGTAPDEDVIAASTSAACKRWTSWSAVVHDSSSSNPVTEVIQTTGTTTFVLVLANGVFGVHARTIPGYSSSSSLLQGFQRGDGCVVIDPVSTIGPLVKGGQARPLLTNVALQRSNAYWQYFKSTPTIAQATQQFASSIKTPLQRTGVAALTGAATASRVFYAPRGTPAPQVAALEAAFKTASNNGQLKSQLIKQGNPTGYETPSTVAVAYRTFLNAAKGATSYLGPIKSSG